MTKPSPPGSERLKSFADRIDRLEEERKAIGGDVKDVYTEVDKAGYSPKALRKVLAERRRKTDEQFEAELETYRAALGMGTYRAVAEQFGVSKSKLQRLVPRKENGTPHHDPETGEIVPVDEKPSLAEEISPKSTPADTSATSTRPEEITPMPSSAPVAASGKEDLGVAAGAGPLDALETTKSCGVVESRHEGHDQSDPERGQIAARTAGVAPGPQDISTERPALQEVGIGNDDAALGTEEISLQSKWGCVIDVPAPPKEITSTLEMGAERALASEPPPIDLTIPDFLRRERASA